MPVLRKLEMKNMTNDKKKKWVMPEWMENYREYICNTGGNPIEELMNDSGTNMFNNHVRMGLIIAVKSQVTLLERLHNESVIE